MAAPTPKPPQERINRVPPQRGEWQNIDVKRLDEPTRPAIIHRKGKTLWKWRSRKRWEEWTCDPASQFWTDGDAAFARDLLFIIEEEGVTSKNLPVLMRGLDKLGLTPAGKRDLRYKITFTPYQEMTKNDKMPDNVIPIDERRTNLGHGA